MSTIIMSQCWKLKMPPTPKAVLISLADNANDQGVCWPSIPTICERTCFSERAVHGAIRWLESVGLVRADRSNGRHTSYTVTPEKYVPEVDGNQRSKCTPAGDAPPQEVQSPPQQVQSPPQEKQSPPQQVRSNRKEPSEPSGNRHKSPARADDDSSSALKASDLVKEGVDKQHAKDWLTLRKAKRLPLIPTAWEAVKGEASKAGMTLDQAVECAAINGWAGFKASWLERPGVARPGQAAPMNKQEALEAQNRAIAERLAKKLEGENHEAE